MNCLQLVGWGISILAAVIASFFTTFGEKNTCSMSYSRPIYHKLEIPSPYSQLSDRYSTYLYREGGVSPHWDGKGKLGGTPVVFIPGNAGSYSQGRSVASLAANLGRELYSETEFDFFLVHFDEDFSAFRGSTLENQAKYVNDAIYHILGLYTGPNAPQAVTLIGHSMGGTVARVMVTLDNYVPKSVNTIFTLATPHLVPPLTMDRGVTELYDRVSRFWRQSFSDGGSEVPSAANAGDDTAVGDSRLDDMTLVSISGGHTDYMVPPEYTPIFSVVPASHGISAYSYSIPGVWRGQDHLAIVWCYELRQVLVESMFAVASAHRPQRTLPRADRIAVLQSYYKSPMDNHELINSQYAFVWSSEPFDGSFVSPVGALGIVSASEGRAVDVAARGRAGRAAKKSSEGHSGHPAALTHMPFNTTEAAYTSIFSLLVRGVRVPINSKFIDVPIPALQSSLIALDVRLDDAPSGAAFRHWVPSTGESRWYQGNKATVFWYSSSPYVPYPVQQHDCLHLQVVAPKLQPAASATTHLHIRINWWASLANFAIRYRTTALCFPAGIVMLVVLIQLHSTFNGRYISFRAALLVLIKQHFWALLLVSLAAQYLLSTSFFRNLVRALQVPSERENISALRSSRFDIADLFAGIDEPALAFIAPLLIVVSTTFVVVVEQTLSLLSVYVLAPLSRLRKKPSVTSRRPARLEPLLLGALIFVVPHQCVFVGAALYHILQATDVQSWKFSVAMVLFWTAAVDVPILAVWFRDLKPLLAFQISDLINIASSAPSVAYVYLINRDTTLNMYPCACPTWMRIFTYTFVGYFAYYALVHGFMHTFMMHYFANFLAGWFIFIATVNDTTPKKTL